MIKKKKSRMEAKIEKSDHGERTLKYAKKKRKERLTTQ